MPSAGLRRAKWWFKHCKVEHAALRAALRTGDSHAAAAALNRFNARKRAVQRLAAQKAEADWLKDIRHNPRRFWTQYRGHRTSGSLHSMEDLASHWGSLYEAGDGVKLQDMFQSVSSCVSEVCASSSASPAAVQAADVLNDQLTLEEVEAALRKLKLGRMAGPDGLRGELLREVYTVEPVELDDGRQVWRHTYDHSPGSIVHDLRLLFNTAFTSGQLPSPWGACFVSAVFKKGDPAALDNYRGIAVGSVIGKLFSLVMHRRMDSWAEDQGLRAKGQAGFRDGKCTNNHVFVLKHLIDRCRGSDRLYACFVDFRKAYDLVRRDLLLQCLADMGVRGNALSCLVSMYWSTPMIVKNGRDRGPSVDSSIGVKQGDPLSPLLFGLFIDRVEAWLQEHAPQCGVALHGDLLRVLLYADDLTLLASSPEGLQALLDALQSFCAANSLHVNVDKSAVVVFGKRKPRRGVEIPPRVGPWRAGSCQWSLSFGTWASHFTKPPVCRPVCRPCRLLLCVPCGAFWPGAKPFRCPALKCACLCLNPWCLLYWFIAARCGALPYCGHATLQKSALMLICTARCLLSCAVWVATCVVVHVVS